MGTYRPQNSNTYIAFLAESDVLVEKDMSLASRPSFCWGKASSVKSRVQSVRRVLGYDSLARQRRGARIGGHDSYKPPGDS